MTHSRLERWKNYERLVISFHFASCVSNVIVLIYNGLKHILPYAANNTKPFVTDLLFSYEPYLCLSKKQHLALYVERLGYEFAAMLVTLVCIS